MKNLEVKTRNTISKKSSYKCNLSNVKVFLRHDEDSIIIRNDLQVEIEIYDNGKLIFNGSKLEFFEQLKK